MATCTVSETVLTAGGDPREGLVFAFVAATPQGAGGGELFSSQEVTATTDSNGNLSVDLEQGSIVYVTCRETGLSAAKIQVPNAGAADLGTLVLEYLLSAPTPPTVPPTVYALVTSFGAVGDGVTDDTDAIQAAIDYVDSLGGGVVFFPAGVYATATGIVVGNGSNSATSTIHNKVRLVGLGYGASTGVIGPQVNGASRILYTGAASSSAAVLTFAGPMYGVGAENLTLDCNSLAGRGIIVNHVTQGTFSRVSARNYTAIGYDLTSRTGFPSGCAFGNADNRFYDCYGFLDDPSLASANIIGVSLSSGVNPSDSLIGNPDSARNVFIGGLFFYGTTVASHGLWLSGADNNSFIEVMLYPYGGSTSGYDVYLQRWAGSGTFPLENYFCNLGMTRGASGNGGIGSDWGNTFFPYPTSDGAAFPALTGASGVDHLGKTYVAGVRAYRGRQSDFAELNGSVQSNSSTTPAAVPGMSVTIACLDGSKLRASFSGRVSKSVAGTGYFMLALNGVLFGPTRSEVNATGVAEVASCEYLFEGLSAGNNTIDLYFASSDANAVAISHGTLIVEELY